MDRIWSGVRANADGYLSANSEDASKRIVLENIGKGLQYEIGTDIKHIIFKLSRYKFVSKLLRFKERQKVLELGCGEAIGAMLLLQNMDISSYLGIDFDESSIEWNNNNLMDDRFKFILGDFNHYEGFEKYDAVISLDVIEHIPKENEDDFCEAITGHLTEGGVAVIGTPHVNMDPYASPGSKIGHVNLFDQIRLHQLMSQYFENVFIFNMNDENVNLSFDKMSCYIFALCCGNRKNH